MIFYNKIIIILCLVVIILCCGIIVNTSFDDTKNVKEVNITNNNTTEVNKEVVKASEDKKTEVVEAYGYCAVCGKALSASEASDEYTQGKVCHSCAINPPGGPDYANQKLKEAYPEEYSWMETGYEDTSDGDSYEV